MGLVLLGVVLLVGGATGLVVLVANPSEEPLAPKDETVASPLSPGPGAPAQYGPVQVHNACDLIPFDFLAGLGMRLEGDGLIEERLPDPYAPPANPGPQESGSTMIGVSACDVWFADSANMKVDINQPPYNAPEEIEQDLDFYREDSDTYTEQGWEVLLYRDEPEEVATAPEYVDGAFARGDTLVVYAFAATSGTPREKALAQAKQAASRVITKLNTSPAAPNQARYPAPYGELPDPCEVFTADDFKLLTHLADSGVLQRSWTPGEVVLLDPGLELTGRYAETECSRGGFAPERSLDTPHVDLRMQTFKSERIARMNFDSHRDPKSVFSVYEGPAEPFSAVIGDAPAQLRKGMEGDRFYMFLVGRHVVEFPVANVEGPEADAVYGPVARRVAERLSGR